MMVMFATLCDDCGKRSEEYTQHPQCRDCGRDICPQCAAPNTFEPDDEGQRASHICSACHEQQED